jgi:histidinol-phosphate phosphatase family protein
VKRAVLLDRDGTLIEERNYLSDPKGVVLLPGAVEALEQFDALGFGVAVVSNQSGVGRGYFTLEDVERVHLRMLELLGPAARIINGIYVCPHAPETHCECRKPRPGLVEQAARELGFDAHASFVIGDKPADIELARNVGARAVLVTTGYGADSLDAGADYVAPGLSAAAAWIASQG